MNLSGNQLDGTKPLNSPEVPNESSLSLSGASHIPIPHSAETDPIFMAWDRHTGITIHQSQIIDNVVADIVPTGLALSSQGLNVGTGVQLAYVILTWDAIVTTTFDHYLVRYKKATIGTYSEVSVHTNIITIDSLLPNTSYNFSVASVNKYGTVSAFCSTLTLTTTADSTLPATVTGVTATAGIFQVVLTWTANTELDLASYNIYRKTTNDSSTSTIIGNVTGTYFVDSGLTGEQIQYYWLKAKDTSNNLSAAYSTVASATPTSISGSNILNLTLTSNLLNIAAINPVDGEINYNKIGTLQLDDNAITEAKILAGAITAAKTSLAAINPIDGEINYNKVGTVQIDDDAVTETQILNAAITSNKIATGAILEGHLSIGSVTANAIAADAITADKILAGAITARSITSYNFVVSEGTFTDNTPTDSISWTGVKVVYAGTEYTITNGTCGVGDKHLYWELATPTVFLHSVALPALTNDGFLVAYNASGVHLLVWNSTIVNGNRITTGSISATNMAANSITANAIEAGSITGIKIAAGTITANRLKTFNFQMTEGAFSNNTPSAGRLSWVGCKTVYDGTEYTITDGSCAASNKHIYWQLSSPTVFSASDTLPALGNDDFIVVFNNSGTAIYVWNSTQINGNRITTGSVTATQIASNTITANNIAAGTIVASNIAAGTITANEIAAGTILASNIKSGEITTTQLNFTPVTGTNVIASINASTEGLTIDADLVTFSGTIAATAGTLGAWHIDSDSIHSGVKVTGEGYAASNGDMTIRSDGSIHAKNFYVDADGEVSFRATSSVLDGVATKTIEIGDWNMDTTASVAVIHGLTFTDIVNVNVVIRGDVLVGYTIYPFTYFDSVSSTCGGNWSFSNIGTTIVLTRTTGGFFDSAAFDATSYNRGYVTIQYLV